ncbi:hypothetical protein PR202_gb23743 [Eleusine coracana subsp. coracana]|uniref:Uncharacterized protein n=1 Tax=Eleusine coracana subsp. coracana TaxID=191504 RepID=A0AAV5FJV6_ELECO|nr:hypothetical protein PR202_gb23743 [Eleusine coracana subsp. coracana]
MRHRQSASCSRPWRLLWSSWPRRTPATQPFTAEQLAGLLRLAECVRLHLAGPRRLLRFASPPRWSPPPAPPHWMRTAPPRSLLAACSASLEKESRHAMGRAPFLPATMSRAHPRAAHGHGDRGGRRLPPPLLGFVVQGDRTVGADLFTSVPALSSRRSRGGEEGDRLLVRDEEGEEEDGWVDGRQSSKY